MTARFVPLASALLLLGHLAPLHRATAQGEPASIPTPLVHALLGRDGMAPAPAGITVSATPARWPAELTPPRATPLGGLRLNYALVAFFVDTAPQPLATYQRLLRDRGFFRPERPTNGFSAGGGPFDFFCRDSETVSATVLPDSARPVLRVEYRRGRAGRSGCGERGMVPSAPALPIPHLTPPQGARQIDTGSGSGTGEVNIHAELVDSTRSLAAIAAHYAAQLAAAGWKTAPGATDSAEAVTTLDVDHPAGTHWHGTLSVTPAEGRRQLYIEMRTATTDPAPARDVAAASAKPADSPVTRRASTAIKPPVAVPSLLVRSALLLIDGSGTVPFPFTVGRTPEDWPATLLPGPRGTVIGGIELGPFRSIVVEFPRSVDGMATYRALLAQSGYHHAASSRIMGEAGFMSGLRSATNGGEGWCAPDSSMVGVAPVDSSPIRRSYEVVWVARAPNVTSSCGGKPPGSAMSATSSIPLHIPSLAAPAGAMVVGGGSSSSDNSSMQVNARADTALSVDALLRHYTAELVHGGWTPLGLPVSTTFAGAQSFSARDADGKEWRGAFIVITSGAGRELLIHMSLPDAR